MDATLDGVDYCGLVDPAALTAIGLPAKGTATSTLGTTTDGCYWAAGHTSMAVHNTPSMLSGFSDHIHEQNFSGFAGQVRYDENLNECDVAIQVGASGLRLTVANPGNDNAALKGKGCDVGTDMMQHLVKKIPIKK